MNILVIGSGGREHALCWKIRQSPLCDQLYAIPGNAGMADVASCVALDPLDTAAIRGFCHANDIRLVVIGPEGPLVNGLADALRADDIPVFGPGRDGAQLEGSKGFMKDLCADAGVPTARYRRCTTLAAAEDFLATLTPPVVVKADGLAAGKGVFICTSHSEASAACRALLEQGSLGAAGQELVLEEFLVGDEISFFALADGKTVIPFATAQDYKRAFDGDAGPNTGGMGAFSPARLRSPTGTVAAEADAGFVNTVMSTIIQPTMAALAARGIAYQGVLYAGLMVGREGPKLLEFNARFGDPECQVLMRRLRGDLVPILMAVAEGRLDETVATGASATGASLWDPHPALTIVVARQGYPGPCTDQTVIRHIPADTAQVTTFHASTIREAETGTLLATGGRVLNVTASGATVRACRDAAYTTARAIVWTEGFFRGDIGAGVDDDDLLTHPG